MPEIADLHMHTFHSDGTHAPEELIEMAVAAGLSAVSLTDHDTTDGWTAFAAAADRAGIEAIPGVELSSRFGSRDTHILGYCVDPANERLQGALSKFQGGRAERGRQMVQRLNAIGVGVSFAAVQRAAGEGVIGRPHVADALAAGGFVRTYDEAFKRYLGLGKPGYVGKEAFEVAEAVGLIHDAGGVAVLAHPSNHYTEEDVAQIAEAGIDGIEVVHPRHTPAHTRMYRLLAERHGLIVSGGSDFHGATRGTARVGQPHIDLDAVRRLKERASWER